MNAPQILNKLVKAIGPISTFYIDYDNGGAAYSELKLTSKGKVTNQQIGKAIKLDSSYLKQARLAARNEGRIESPIIGAFSAYRYQRHLDVNALAAVMIVNIASSAKLRAKYRSAIIKAVTAYKKIWATKRLAQADPNAPDYFGWRIWYWDEGKRRLISPVQHTVWHSLELRVPQWDRNDVVRGYAGIHATRLPYDWRKAPLDGTELNGYTGGDHNIVIVGKVERFGKYVLGTEGWRAEWVIIRDLKAPNSEIGLALEQAYPDLIGHIYYDE